MSESHQNRPTKCVVCDSNAFRSDYPYGDCCGMYCAAEKNTPDRPLAGPPLADQHKLRELQKTDPDKVEEHTLPVGSGRFTYVTRKVTINTERQDENAKASKKEIRQKRASKKEMCFYCSQYSLKLTQCHFCTADLCSDCSHWEGWEGDIGLRPAGHSPTCPECYEKENV